MSDNRRCFTVHVSEALYRAIGHHADAARVTRMSFVEGELAHLLDGPARANEYPARSRGGYRDVPDAPRCGAITNRGVGCRRHATRGDLCGRHFALQVLDERGARPARVSRETAPSPIARPKAPARKVPPYIAPREVQRLSIAEGRPATVPQSPPPPSPPSERPAHAVGGVVLL